MYPRRHTTVPAKAKGEKKKPVNYELIDKDGPIGQPIYGLLDDLVAKHHSHLSEARFAIAWCTSWKPDADGICKLGMIKKAGDLDRELANYDLIIMLRKSFWRSESVTHEQRAAVLDHELCHAVRAFDANGRAIVDERDRPVYRLRKHDIEEFVAIVQRYGAWRHELEAMHRALLLSAAEGFKPCVNCERTPGWVEIYVDGAKSVKRCECWHTWQLLKAEAKEIVH